MMSSMNEKKRKRETHLKIHPNEMSEIQVQKENLSFQREKKQATHNRIKFGLMLDFSSTALDARRSIW